MATDLQENPRQNVTTVFAFWRSCRSKTVGPVSTNGDAIFSYKTPLLARGLRDGRMTGYVFLAKKAPGRFSKTTAQHLSSLYELMEPHRMETGWQIAEVDQGDLQRAISSGDFEELIITSFDEPLRNPPRTFGDFDKDNPLAARDFDVLEDNPPWVTKLLADSLVTLQEQIPPKWMPKWASSVAGSGNVVRAELAEFGCGAYGCVMPTLDKTVVLKLSSDPSEAQFAANLADTLPTDCVVHYHTIVKLEGAERKGREVFLLWRESADAVGQIHKVVGMKAERAIRKQHRAALEAYLTIAAGDVDGFMEQIELWRKACFQMARIPELHFVASGMVRAWDEKGIFISDTHGGNLGLCMRNGKPTWVITDPGNVVVSTEHADERRPLSGPPTKRQMNPGKKPRRPCPVNFDHKKLTEGPLEEWEKLPYVGDMDSYDENDNEIVVELRNCPCGSTIARPKPTPNPWVPKRGAQRFFDQYAGYSWTPGQENRRAGQLRSSRELAVAEYVLEEEHPDAEVLWEEDQDSWTLRKEDARNGIESSEYYTAVLTEDEETLAVLGGIGDPDANFRRLVEAELAAEAWPERVNELAQQLQRRHGQPFRVNPHPDVHPDGAKRVMHAFVAVAVALERRFNPKDYLPHSDAHVSLREVTEWRLRQIIMGAWSSDLYNDHARVVKRYLDYFVDKGLLERASDGRYFASAKATAYDNRNVARWPDPTKSAVGQQVALRQAFNSAELARYITSFIGEAWDVRMVISTRMEITNDAGLYGLAIEMDEAPMGFGQWPSLNAFVVSNDLAYPPSIEMKDFNLLAVNWPYSPLELVAIILPFTDVYHP